VLARLESGAASQIILEANAPIRCVTPSGPQAVSQQTLTSKQVLALVGEMATADQKASVSAGRDIRFLYAWNGQQWLVEQDGSAPHTRLTVQKHVTVAEPAVAPAPPAPAVRRYRASDVPFEEAADTAVTRERFEALLREQVRRGAADLHLRVGEPPILRLGGDLVRIEDQSTLDDASVSRMVRAIMPPKNLAEFDANWDTDFAYEITGVSRFRVNVLRDRNGAAAVVRTISATALKCSSCAR
jgi:twitching motility protein PilT